MGRVAAKEGELQTEPPYLKDAFSVRNLPPVFQIVAVGFYRRSKSSHRWG
jgi:hypothetical protein